MINDNADNSLQHPESEFTGAVKRKGMTPLRWIALAVAVAITLFQIISTELRVVELRADGFSDFVITSTRNHAYFPLIGGLVGALTVGGIGRMLKFMFKSERG
jgi:hypothetical protein